MLWPAKSMDFLSTSGKTWSFSSRHETGSSFSRPERSCEHLPLPHSVLDLKSTTALLCTMLSKADLPLPACVMGAFLLAKCCSGSAGVPLRNISPSVSLWHHWLLPHWGPQVGWYLLCFSLSALMRFVTLTAEGLDKEPYHNMWVTQLWAHTSPPPPEKSLEDKQLSSGILSGVSPMSFHGKNSRILFLSETDLLGFRQAICILCMGYATGALLIQLGFIWYPAKLWYKDVLPRHPGRRALQKSYVSHFLGWLLSGIILPIAVM